MTAVVNPETPQHVRRTAASLALASFLGLLTAAPAVHTRRLTGQVTRVVDGDTLVLEVEGDRHRVRLAGVDAPEKNQPWGDAASRELRRQVAGKPVVLDWYKKDRWQRLIGVARLGGEEINLHMVDRGLAWHYKRYAAEQPSSDREAYSAAERAAQGARRALWSDPSPVSPWDGRKR